MKNQIKIKKISVTAMFCALAYVCMLYIKIPGIAGFLTLDVKDTLIVLCSLLLGPIPGLVIAVTVPFLEMITISSTQVYGFIMNTLSSVTFAAVAGVIYKFRRSMSGAVIGLVSAVCSVTAVMLVANLLITPHFLGGTTAEVAAMIPKVLLPFNLVKATLNAAMVLLLYKPLSTVLKKTGLLPKRQTEQGEVQDAGNAKGRILMVSGIALAVIALSLCVVYFVLGV